MNSYKEHFSNYFDKVTETLGKFDIEPVKKFIDRIYECYNKGNTVYIFGNGGSAATASHVAGDFMKGISYGLEKRFKVVCLNDNLPAITAISNDLTYDEVFYEQLKTFLKKDDIVVGISGSGNSANVIKALNYAKELGSTIVGFCGYKGGKLKQLADILIYVPVSDMEITEDIHLIIFHAIKQLINKKMKGNKYSMGFNYDKRVE
jgi:D-sedoheptulose 7-phosphate isomerase